MRNIIKAKIRVIGLLLTVTLLVIIQTMTLNAQCDKTSPKSSSVVSQKTYDRVLDILFPRQPSTLEYVDFSIAIRFHPSFAPKSQIVISKFKNKVEVTEYKSLNGNISDNLNQILAKNCKEDAEAMAKQIKIEKKTKVVSLAKVNEWHNNFLTSLGDSLNVIKQRSRKFDETGEVTVILDGVTYQLWYENNSNKIELSFYDEEIDDSSITGDSPVVQWMNKVRLELQK